MSKEFENMTPVEIAEAIYDCACENMREQAECDFVGEGIGCGFDPRTERVVALVCEDAKLPLGEHITLWVDANFNPRSERCEDISVSVYDGDEDGYERYEAYKAAIGFELKKQTGAYVQMDY